MSTKRAWSASAVLNEDILFISGGMTTWGFPLDSTELIKYGGKTKTGPKMPFPLAGHVHVGINQTDSLEPLLICKALCVGYQFNKFQFLANLIDSRRSRNGSLKHRIENAMILRNFIG